MCAVFSQRKKPKPDTLGYDLPTATRQRIIYSLQPIVDEGCQVGAFSTLLDQLKQLLLEQYGKLDGYNAASSVPPALQHFTSCPTEHALDFLELLFRCPGYWSRDRAVEAINRILQEEGIGYELTPYTATLPEPTPSAAGARPVVSRPRFVDTTDIPGSVQYPQVIEKGSEYMHAEVIRPCLDLLTNPKFKTANEEMLKAHQEYRDGKYDDAITDCGSVLETVLKTICAEKKWAYDKDKDTCSNLVEICRTNGLFFPFYAPYFTDAGTIRNKLSDAHGKGPAAQYKPEKEHFEHLVQITSANILLLARLAGMR